MPLVLAGLIAFVMQKKNRLNNGNTIMLFWLTAAVTMPKDEGAYIVENREIDYFDQEKYQIQKFKYYSVLIPLK